MFEHAPDGGHTDATGCPLHDFERQDPSSAKLEHVLLVYTTLVASGSTFTPRDVGDHEHHEDSGEKRGNGEQQGMVGEVSHAPWTRQPR
ncbi:putative uncharacterized protein PLT3-1 [Mycolicibacterium fortuitum subsp. acetamidolyticum]|uniref:Uncharacterized protein n=1 Tax=Mycolicibacterium fortuitum subsp. acetamidolyticum TaxID=144550 RepID=A0A100WM02_MYCFO|nr:putative uncharacterized protein PLT3-1 [Mycolicibacterium fortuitum subsp. acetamidolyticum]